MCVGTAGKRMAEVEQVKGGITVVGVATVVMSIIITITITKAV